MGTINIHQANIHVSRLVEQAARGQEFVIAKAGEAMVRGVPFHAADRRRALGGLAGGYKLPADIATMIDLKP